MQPLKPLLTKIAKFLIQWDTIWSAPLAFAAMLVMGAFGSWFFGEGFAGYDASFIQAIIIAALILVAFNGVVWAGLYINFKGVYDWYLNDFQTEFKNLPIWVKVSFTCFLYCFLLVLLLVLFLKLV